MLNWIINWSLRHRLMVLGLALLFVLIGGLALSRINIDAFPDTTPVQVQVNTAAPALSPEEIERQVTFPVEQAISGLPNLREGRSTSKSGLSAVVVPFRDAPALPTARTLVNERVGSVNLPAGIKPRLGPIATGLG